MKRSDILYGIEVVLFNHPRKEYQHDILDRLEELGYIDWFSWYDDKLGRVRLKINATQKGLLYYNKYKHRSPYKGWAILGLITLILPYVFILI